MKINKNYIFEIIFDTFLLVCGIHIIYQIFFYTEDELMVILQDAASHKARRNREIVITILSFLGKEGVLVFFGIGFYLVFKYRFLLTLRNFLGKDISKEEDK